MRILEEWSVVRSKIASDSVLWACGCADSLSVVEKRDEAGGPGD